jgi:hypothetical protein
MSLLLELLEHVLDYVNSWRLYVALAATAIALWLVLEFMAPGMGRTLLVVAVAVVGIVGGYRWARAAG